MLARLPFRIPLLGHDEPQGQVKGLRNQIYPWPPINFGSQAVALSGSDDEKTHRAHVGANRPSHATVGHTKDLILSLHWHLELWPTGKVGILYNKDE